MGIIENFNRRIAKGIVRYATKYDALRDPLTSRGGRRDKTQRMIAGEKKADDVLLRLYNSGGFIQTVVNRPARDIVREGFEIETTLDQEFNLNRKITNRLEELKSSEKCYDLFRFSRIFNRGAFMFFGVDETNTIEPKLETMLAPGYLKAIDFVNVTDNPSQVMVRIDNRFDPTKRAYNIPEYWIYGRNVHPSRIIWSVDNFVPSELQGTSVAQNVYDAIVAVDSALWSSSSMLAELSFKIFTSPYIVQMAPEKRAEILDAMVHSITTQSSVALDKEESLTRLDSKVQGIKEVYDFIFDSLAGTAQVSRSILLGKSWGVVGSDDNETQNYYAAIKQMQNEKYLPILNLLIKLILSEQSGEIYQTIGERWRDVDWKIKFKPLYTLSEKSLAEIRLSNAQADQLDVTIGKASPQEVKELDSRYTSLDDLGLPPEGNEAPLNFSVPAILDKIITPDPAKKAPPDTGKVI